jgi:hypothetical protein
MLTNKPEYFVWPVDIACTFISENILIPNIYHLSIGMEPTIDTEDVDLGFKKLKHFVNDYLQNGIFINESSDLVKPLNKLDTNLVLFPDEPYDVLVAGILYRKFAAITEKYFEISFLTIDSSVGDHIQYTLTVDSEILTEFDGDFWWNKDSVNTGTDDHTSWDDLNLNKTPRFAHIVVKGGKSENR